MARVHLAELDIDRAAAVAAMPLPRLQKRLRFLGARRVDAPFLGARDDHRGVKGLELLLRALGHGVLAYGRGVNRRITRNVPMRRRARLPPIGGNACATRQGARTGS